MVNLVHARQAQSLISDQEYRKLLHQYTSVTDDMRLQCAKKAYKLQSEVNESHLNAIILLGLTHDSYTPDHYILRYPFEQELWSKQ